MPKLDRLHKHIGRRKHTKPRLGSNLGDFYINYDSEHAKNEKIYNTTRFDSIIDQELNAKKAYKKKKNLEFVIIFHLLKQGKPMTYYECMESFFAFLKVGKVFKLHWGCIHNQGTKKE